MKTLFNTCWYHLCCPKWIVSLSSRSAVLLFVFQFLNGLLCETHIYMYTIWKLQVLATYCFLFQGNPLSIKRDIDILLGPLVKLQTAELNGWADVSVGTLALTPNGLVACHPCIKLIVQCCRRRNYLNISLYLKGFRPLLRKICDFENEKISTAHGVPKRSPI